VGFVVSAFLGTHLADARPGKKGIIYLDLADELSIVRAENDIIGGMGGKAKLGYRTGNSTSAWPGVS